MNKPNEEVQCEYAYDCQPRVLRQRHIIAIGHCREEPAHNQASEGYHRFNHSQCSRSWIAAHLLSKRQQLIRRSLRRFVTYPRAGVSVRAPAGCGRVRAVRRRAVIRHFARESHVLTVLAERHVDRISIERS